MVTGDAYGKLQANAMPDVNHESTVLTLNSDRILIDKRPSYLAANKNELGIFQRSTDVGTPSRGVFHAYFYKHDARETSVRWEKWLRAEQRNGNIITCKFIPN